MQVFIKDEATQEQIDELGKSIRELNGVNTVEYVSKEEALEDAKEMFKDYPELIEGFDDEEYFLSASYVITLTDLNLSQEVYSTIDSFEMVKNIQSRDTTVTKLISIANGIKIITGVILILLIIISTFIISNTIKLTVHARRKEISIMKYVGATNGFIRWPFIVEGMIIGVIASAISIVIIGVSYSFIAEKVLQDNFIELINASLVSFGEMFNSIIFVYMLLGIGIGAIGSVISMRKYLKV